MATVSLLYGTATATGFPSRDYLHTVGVYSVQVSLSKAMSIKGSKLVAADELEVLTIPSGAMILGASCEIVNVPVKAGTAVTSGSISLGIHGGSLNLWVNGNTFATAGICNEGVPNTANTTNYATHTAHGPACHYTVGSGGAIVSLQITSTSGSITAGVIRVDVIVAQIASANNEAHNRPIVTQLVNYSN